MSEFNIIDKVENKRNCGYRQPGGMYLVSSGIAKTCFKFPVALTVCPHCGEGIKFSRGWTWITNKIIKAAGCNDPACEKPCYPFNGEVENFGLLWVGEKFYKKPIDFSLEAVRMGVSKRISQIPRDFELGKTWVLLAHPKAIEKEGEDGEMKHTGAIFAAFQPTRIEYIVTGEETPKQMKRMKKQGFTFIRVTKSEDLQMKIEHPEEETA